MELEIPEEYTKTEKGNFFLIFDRNHNKYM